MPYREAEWVLNKIWRELVDSKSVHARSLEGKVSVVDADIVLLVNECLDKSDTEEKSHGQTIDRSKL